MVMHDLGGQVDQWKKMSHSNLVTLRQVFTSKSFGDHSMVFVYDFFPGSETLMSRWGFVKIQGDFFDRSRP